VSLSLSTYCFPLRRSFKFFVRVHRTRARASVTAPACQPSVYRHVRCWCCRCFSDFSPLEKRENGVRQAEVSFSRVGSQSHRGGRAPSPRGGLCDGFSYRVCLLFQECFFHGEKSRFYEIFLCFSIGCPIRGGQWRNGARCEVLVLSKNELNFTRGFFCEFFSPHFDDQQIRGKCSNGWNYSVQLENVET
jgi:hypothetical protein